jgi:hypothetical protein
MTAISIARITAVARMRKNLLPFTIYLHQHHF